MESANKMQKSYQSSRLRFLNFSYTQIQKNVCLAAILVCSASMNLSQNIRLSDRGMFGFDGYCKRFTPCQSEHSRWTSKRENNGLKRTKERLGKTPWRGIMGAPFVGCLITLLFKVDMRFLFFFFFFLSSSSSSSFSLSFSPSSSFSFSSSPPYSSSSSSWILRSAMRLGIFPLGIPLENTFSFLCKTFT